MKTFLRFALLTVLLGGAAFATAEVISSPSSEPAPRHANFFRARMGVVSHQLGLTDTQKSELKTIHRQAAATLAAIRASSALTPEQKQAQLSAARQAAREQMRAVLTPEQQAKFAQLREHPRRLNAMTVRRMARQRVAQRLELTSDQRTRIHAIQSQTMAAMKPLWNDTSLTPEQRTEKVQALLQTRRDQVQAVLTPEQQTKLAQMRERLLARLGPLG